MFNVLSTNFGSFQMKSERAKDDPGGTWAEPWGVSVHASFYCLGMDIAGVFSPRGTNCSLLVNLQWYHPSHGCWSLVSMENFSFEVGQE